MLKMILKKIKNKLWLTLCLLLGMSFLIAVISSQPMFEEGSLNMLLNNTFRNYVETENRYPTVMGRTGSYNTLDIDSLDVVETDIKNYEAVWYDYISDVDVLDTQTVVSFDEESCQGSYGSKGNYLKISYIPGVENHTKIVQGEVFSDETEPGREVYPCMISELVMDEYGLVEGEILDFINWKDEKGNTLKLKITGIYTNSKPSDLFWFVDPTSLSEHVLVTKNTFDLIINNYSTGASKEVISYRHYCMLDYLDIKSKNVDNIAYYIQEFKRADKAFFDMFSPMLDSFMAERKTVNVILWVLQLPILGMVFAFIYMVSKQIVETEKNEIAMLRSRGLKRIQIIAMYFMQAGIIAILGMIMGLPLGYGLCKLSAAATDFLTFSFDNVWMYGFNTQMVTHGMVAAVIGVIFILIPVMSSTNVSIVEYKSTDRANKKPVWEKYFLDIALFGVAIYLLYNFNQDKETIRTRALEGNKMDPMIFLDSVLFIVAFGLVVLRLIHYLVKLIYRIGKKKWKPAMYASFLQITRTTAKQGFISVFLILTVALGLFNANTARTINRNNEDRIMYENGTDITLQETWEKKIFFIPVKDVDYEFKEPDYGKYENLVSDGICESITRVIVDDRTTASHGEKSVEDITLWGINTKEFGETAILKDELNGDKHWYNYLNAMAARQDGVVISANLADKLGLSVGDDFRCVRYGVIPKKMDTVRGSMNARVCAIVEHWPGYDRYYYDEEGKLKEKYLVVANYANVSKCFKISPYEIWMKLSDGYGYEDVERYLQEINVELEGKNVVTEKVDRMKSTPMIQITNGMFTLSFIIALVLCGIGFLIYWVSSIRQRELLFGVYRAMGMSVKEINRMLVNEHIFSTILSVLAGGGVGMVSTILFVKLFGIVYLPEKHNLDIYIYFEIGDIIKLAAAIIVMIMVCIMVLRQIIKSLNITQALKLGEE